MTRLEKLADAIRKHEGWYPYSRSWRNNNPGNLRWSKFQTGQKDNFAYFDSFASGWLALWWDLYCKSTGRTRTKLTGESSLIELFAVWAPRSDRNNPLAYANQIAKQLNITTETKLKWFLVDF